MTPDAYTIKEQMLPVGDGHELYVVEWGNKAAGQTFLYLHGGPGAGCNNKMKSVFDGMRDHVIFFDQRGAGKSTPQGSLVANTTQHLINDINKILEIFGLKQIVVVGGSWGSTLALAYAIAHPERVSALVLRGVFTGTQSEDDYLHKGGFRHMFPDVWDAYLARTPNEHHSDPSAYHMPRALSDDPEAAKESAYALDEMEGSISSRDDRHMPQAYDTFNPNPARIETHYLYNHCFMDEQHIQRNLPKLTMPVWIVQGRYDTVCPPETAYAVHKVLPHSSLIFTDAGHTLNDRGNFDATKSIISTLAQR